MAQEEYGLRCLLQVARAEDGSLTTTEIAEREGLTEAYVHKLMRILRRAGFVQSVRGRNGGYQLASPAEQINVGAVLACLGGNIYTGNFCSEHRGNERTCVHNVDCAIRSLWIAIDQSVQRLLRHTQLKDLLRTEPAMEAFIQAQPERVRLGHEF